MKTTLSNTIIGNNNASDCAFRGNWKVISEGFNLDSDGTCIQDGQNSDITASEIFITGLADNGGTTLTHALLPNSPAVDAGNCAGGTITVDQRGIERPQSIACDIGAFELIQFRVYLPVLPSIPDN